MMKSIIGSFTRPVNIILGLGTVLLCVFGITDTYSAATIIVLALFQNTAYSLQARARMRSSNVYHALAALAATAVFFMTLRFLFASNVPFALLVPYTFGTVAGTLYGVKLSQWIEEKIGAVANLGEETKGQTLSFGLTVLCLSVLAALQMVFIQSYSTAHMAAILGTAFASNFLFSGLMVARNTNAYWSHLGFILVQSCVAFFIYDIMLKTGGNWYLFAPYVTGTMLGSITGTWVSKRIETALKSSWDAHVVEKGSAPWPIFEAFVAFSLFGPYVLFFEPTAFAALVFAAALAQNCAFALISRARQRKHEGYIEWTSVFSNGIWFLTLGVLVVGQMEIALLIPYVVGTAVGSLLGQGIAMRIEKRIGAVIGETNLQKV